MLTVGINTDSCFETRAKKKRNKRQVAYCLRATTRAFLQKYFVEKLEKTYSSMNSVRYGPIDLPQIIKEINFHSREILLCQEHNLKRL